MALMDLWEMVTWQASEYAWLIGFIAFFSCVSYVRYIVKSYRILQLLDQQSQGLIQHGSLTRKLYKFFLLIIGLIALGIACLRPQWGTVDRPIQQQGRDLFILLDISGSMRTIDCFGKSRLAYAQEKIKSLVLDLDQTRVGLILFAHNAFIQCPLTFDKKAFFMFLDAVDTEVVSAGFTRIEQGLQLVLDNYKSVPHSKTKLVLICTDGEDFSTDLLRVKEAAQKENISLFTFGIGTTKGAPIPLYDLLGKHIGYQKDAQNKVVISRLDESLLHDLSQKLGGDYIGIQELNEDVHQIVSLIHAREKNMFEAVDVKDKIDQYWIFIAVSFAALILEWLL